MVAFTNLIVFGDSMSDIGTKWTESVGRAARVFGAMRVNKAGRYSDGKNWSDFLIKWSTGYDIVYVGAKETRARSKRHLSLDPRSQLLTGSHAPFGYVNYATGGAIVDKGWTRASKAIALSPVSAQVETYLAQREAFPLRGPTLHIIWIGLNDFVTLKRPDYDPKVIQPKGYDFEAWKGWTIPENLRAEIGVWPLVLELRRVIDNLIFGLGKRGIKDDRIMLVDLPSVYNSIRYAKGLMNSEKESEAEGIDPAITRYNGLLASLVSDLKAKPPESALSEVMLVELSNFMGQVGAHLDAWGLSQKAQDTGVPVNYPPALDPVGEAVRRCITTSDRGHPTEAVYNLIAAHIALRLVRDYKHELGDLTEAALQTIPTQERNFTYEGLEPKLRKPARREGSPEVLDSIPRAREPKPDTPSKRNAIPEG